MKRIKWFEITSLLIVFVFFGLLVTGRILYQVNYGSDVSDNGDEINWKELYPFTKEIEEIKSDKTDMEENDTSFLVRIFNTFNGLGDEFVSLMAGQDQISKAGFVLNSFLTDPSYSSNYIKLNNDYWTKKESKESQDTLNSIADNYLSLQNYLDKNNIGFLYVQTPVKECRYDDELPYGIESFSNINIDVFVDLLKEKKINYMDLRDNLHEDGMDHYSMFYKTDHHWNANASFWAADEIEKKLGIEENEYFGSYEIKEYPKAMFGSYGKAVTHAIAEAEDFNVLCPEFETEFEVVVPSKGINKIGSFEEVFVDNEGLIEMMNKGGDFAYEMIAYGNKPLIEIKNMNNTEGLKILMIRDSFSIGVVPYLALTCSQLSLIDTRVNQGNFTGSIINYIDNYDPDIVIALQSIPQSLKLNK